MTVGFGIQCDVCKGAYIDDGTSMTMQNTNFSLPKGFLRVVSASLVEGARGDIVYDFCSRGCLNTKLQELEWASMPNYKPKGEQEE
jgi:hypothetical protein